VIRLAARLLTTATLAAVAGCSGYAELPLALREAGDLEIESATLAAGAPGRVQVAIGLPDDAIGPAVMVGNPTVDRSLGGEVVAWAYGACPDGPSPSDARPRLCVAVMVTTTAPPDALFLSAVVETRGDGRRFTVGGEVPLP